MSFARNRHKWGKNHFCDSWLDEVDGNGDKLSVYVQKESTHTFKCSYCQKSDLSFENQGLLQIIQHAQGKKHRKIADIRGGRVHSVQVLGVIAENDETSEEPNAEQSNNEEIQVCIISF